MSRGRFWRNLRACASIFRISLAEGMQYRFAALSGSLVSVFYALIEIIVLTVFYTYGNGNANGMGLSAAVSYMWLGQVFLCLISGGIEASILNKIDSGDMGVELCRPLSLYGNWFFQNMGKRVASLVWRGGPTLLAGLLLPGAFRLGGPASPVAFLCFVLSMGTACLLAASWVALVSAVRMNVQWGDGPMHMLLLLNQLLSGVALPLQLWPDFMQKLLVLQPFAGTIDLPFRLYLGILQPGDALWVLGLQLFWTAVFVALGARLMGRKLKTIVVQGG